MTDEELVNLEALADAATPGPWVFIKDRSTDRIESLSPESDHYVASGTCYGDLGIENEDAEFICAARHAVPSLIDSVRALRSTLAKEIASRRELEAELKAARRSSRRR